MHRRHFRFSRREFNGYSASKIRQSVSRVLRAEYRSNLNKPVPLPPSLPDTPCSSNFSPARGWLRERGLPRTCVVVIEPEYPRPTLVYGAAVTETCCCEIVHAGRRRNLGFFVRAQIRKPQSKLDKKRDNKM